MEAILKAKTNIIITRQIQSVIVRFFLTDFKNRIAKSDFGPVIDPTEGLKGIYFVDFILFITLRTAMDWF
jgi:hypothetical protein